MDTLRALMLLALACAGCSALPAVLKKQEPVPVRDFTEGRLTEVSVADEEGEREARGLFFLIPRRRALLQAVIVGRAVDPDDNPAPDLEVAIQAVNPEAWLTAPGGRLPEVVFPTNPRTDNEGRYRLPIQVELIGGRTDIRGRILYAVNWEQRCREGGRCLEPFERSSDFRLIFDRREGVLVFSESAPRVPFRERPGPPGSPRSTAPETAEVDDAFKATLP